MKSQCEIVQRRAYGFRNFENYRLRVLIECGHFYIPQKDVFNNDFERLRDGGGAARVWSGPPPRLRAMA